MTNDPLFDILQKQIHSSDPETMNETQVIYETVAAYILYLMGQGNIPHDNLDELEDDVKEEVRLMYRKITYGSLSLKDYRLRKKQ